MSDETPVIVTAESCTHCHELKEKHPEAFTVAKEFDLDKPVCGPQPFADGEEVCLTGAEILQAAGANYTPYCGIIDKEGNVKDCSKQQFEAILRGETPPPAPKRQSRRGSGVTSLGLDE